MILRLLFFTLEKHSQSVPLTRLKYKQSTNLTLTTNVAYNQRHANRNDSYTDTKGS